MVRLRPKTGIRPVRAQYAWGPLFGTGRRFCAQCREAQLTGLMSNRLGSSKVTVRREGQQFLETCHRHRGVAGAWMTAIWPTRESRERTLLAATAAFLSPAAPGRLTARGRSRPFAIMRRLMIEFHPPCQRATSRRRKKCRMTPTLGTVQTPQRSVPSARPTPTAYRSPGRTATRSPAASRPGSPRRCPAPVSSGLPSG